MICEKFKPEIKGKMHALAIDSAMELIEYGAQINRDYTLGPVVKGEKYHVVVEPTPEAIGLFHTHVHSWTKPSAADIATALLHNYDVQCVGSTTYLKGSKVKCYTSKKDDLWEELRERAIQVQRMADEFNAMARKKYPRLRGEGLRRRLEPEDWDKMVAVERARRFLYERIDAAFSDLVEDCVV